MLPSGGLADCSVCSLGGGGDGGGRGLKLLTFDGSVILYLLFLIQLFSKFLF